MAHWRRESLSLVLPLGTFSYKATQMCDDIKLTSSTDPIPLFGSAVNHIYILYILFIDFKPIDKALNT